MKFNTQVNKNHYSKDYDSLQRFISYFHQIDLIRRLNIEDVLEIGIGNKTVSNYLKEQNIKITTCDFDKTLNPDYIADIRKLPFNDEKFSCVTAFEILEHLPFRDFSVALSELSRVSKRYVIVSIPYSSFYIEFLIRFPFVNKIIKKDFLRLFLHFPFFSHKYLSDQHYWEIGRKGYSLRKVEREIEKKFKIIKQFRFPILTYHQFFVLEKK